ncbi:MAG TPA: hypothetical protein VLG49_04580 [Rhabdochlamydiaceae bacterium]|nr:hypothetical protein [Rhabdochlamydiaceae bacterium]
MPGTIKPESPSDSFWPESSNSARANSENVPFINTRNKECYLKEFLYSVDDSPDFHDPFSDLNLFLSQKIMQEMRESGFAKKWCVKIQEELIEKITPEFQKKFPQYRLGISALRKTWEKIAYYSQQIRHQKEAITQDGKLNIHFFIRENLKQYSHLKNPYNLHPYHYAHQLAVKMSECIATVEGIRPKLDHLTKMIWAMQRHLLTETSPQTCKSPYDEYDKIDKLIVKTILEMTAKEPHLSQNELEHQVKESLESLRDLPSFASLDSITCNVSALLAEKLYPHSSFHTSFLSEQKKAICNFIRRQIVLYKGSVPTPQLSELVRRITALYMLASGLPKNLSEEEIQSAIKATYPVLKETKPCLNQSIYAFISAESVLMKNDQYCHSVEYVADTISLAYQEAKCLPELRGPAWDILEIVIWKTLSETEGLLENLPYVIGQRIDEEIANTLIDNPNQCFSSLVASTVNYFKRIKELALCKKWAEIERKIHLWSLQGDMLCRWIRLDSDNPLLKMISEKCLSSAHCESLNHYQEFISEICVQYLKNHPELAIYAPKLMNRIVILYKYAWYALMTQSHESSFDRFLQWHSVYFVSHSPHLEAEQLLKLLEELCKKMIPLIPFDSAHCRHLIFKEKNHSNNNQGNAQILPHI